MCILLFPKVSVHSNHSINLKKEGKLLAHELLAEIINFLPLKLKWPNLRISFIFDLFLFKKQSQWIITIKKHIYLERMTTSQMITTTKKLIDHLLSVKENNNNILVAIDSSDKYVLKSARKALNVFLDFKIEEKKIQEKENVEE
uniref:Uncharacterized protein n=1 Tax=Meloidogyne hapla TaxID=6305 RepID=A0A1I8BZ08_MELHA